jgi:hypothetical protein
MRMVLEVLAEIFRPVVDILQLQVTGVGRDALWLQEENPLALAVGLWSVSTLSTFWPVQTKALN